MEAKNTLVYEHICGAYYRCHILLSRTLLWHIWWGCGGGEAVPREEILVSGAGGRVPSGRRQHQTQIGLQEGICPSLPTPVSHHWEGLRVYTRVSSIRQMMPGTSEFSFRIARQKGSFGVCFGTEAAIVRNSHGAER